MAIRVSHTPYGAVGGLAEYAGQAQQAIREQQYTEQEAAQARSIAAQKEMQAKQIGASREEWQRKLTSQQEQFAMQRAAQQEQIFRQQQASEFATMKQSQAQRAQITAQQEQFEQNLATQQQKMLSDKAVREQAFELQRAQEERLTQSAQATIRAQEIKGAFDLTKLEAAKGAMAGNLADWKKMQGQISSEEYIAGTIAISQGKVPRVRAETDALIREKRELDIEKTRAKMAAGLSDRGRTVAQEAFSSTFGTAAGKWAGLWSGMDKAALKGKYEDYLVRTGYANKNPAEKRELDQLFDVNIKTYEDAGWFDYYSEWNPKDKDIKKMRTEATQQIIPGSLGKISKPEAIKLAQQVAAAHPEYNRQQVLTAAKNIATSKGYDTK